MTLQGGFYGYPTDREKKKQKEWYQQNLFEYNKTLIEKDESSYQYRQVCAPFQLVVETDPDDFMGGIAEGMKVAVEKMNVAIMNFMAAQLKAKEWPIDTFKGRNGKLCFGMTAYLLTDGEMQQLEEILHNGLEA